MLISERAFDVGWEVGGCGLRHNALLTSSQGRCAEERALVRREALAELAGLGLARGSRLHPDLLATLRVLDHPQRECYGWFNSDDAGPDTGSVLAASVDDHAVLAVLSGGSVSLAPIRSAELAEAVVSALPPARPATLGAVSFAEVDLDVRAERPAPGSVLLAAAPERPSPAVREARAILGRRRTGGGVLHAAARDRPGRRHRAAGEVCYFDTHDQGRILVRQRVGDDGLRWITLAPGEAAAIAGQLRALARQVPPPRR